MSGRRSKRERRTGGAQPALPPAHPPTRWTHVVEDRRFGAALLATLLGIGAVFRAWLSFHDDGIYWPDEIYQGLEPAHRLVFGSGLVAWEFIEGARTWALPGLVALLMKACAIAASPIPGSTSPSRASRSRRSG